MEAAGTVGLDPDRALNLTFREYDCYARGMQRREIDHWRLGMYVAWHAAIFQRQKKPPSLEKAMEPFDRLEPGRRKAARLTPQQLLAKVVAINRQLGGKPLAERKRK